jgi:O-antigen ligase
LPTVQKQPGRDELWKAALKMIAARPLTGVGPNGYRLNYGYFASPPLAEWDTQIFANSLPLEIFADLGLLGGLCYIAFFGALGWPLLKAFRQHNGLAVWQIAVIGAIAAFLGHGLVDYILGSHAINILFWVVFGLASLEITAKSNRSLD